MLFHYRPQYAPDMWFETGDFWENYYFANYDNKITYMHMGCGMFTNYANRDLGSSIANKSGVVGQQIFLEKRPQCRVDFLFRQVTRSAQNDKDMRSVVVVMGLLTDLAKILPQELKTFRIALFKCQTQFSCR